MTDLAKRCEDATGWQDIASGPDKAPLTPTQIEAVSKAIPVVMSLIWMMHGCPALRKHSTIADSDGDDGA